MVEIQDFDADGYALDFESDIQEEERKFYVQTFPNVDNVTECRLHCTSCNAHIGAAPASESTMRMHPILHVTQCKKCHTFYNSGEFSKGEDGSELYCRWCGQGGEVYCCSKCPYVFCKKCIVQNLPRGTVKGIEETDNWDCFSCSPKIMWTLRATHWAHANYLEKMKKKILTQHTDDDDICTAMHADPTSCCGRDKKTRSARNVTRSKRRRRISSSSSSSGSKSASETKEDSDSESLLQVMKQKKKKKKKSSSDGAAVLPTYKLLQPKPKEAPKAPKDDVVCTPDIMMMFSNAASTEPPPTPTVPKVPAPKITVRQPPPLAVRQYNQSAPNASRRNTTIRPALATPSAPSDQATTPVYHTINGFRIDLNSAAQSDTFRLPNGKLIQVKKQANGPSGVRQVRPIQPAPLAPRINQPVNYSALRYTAPSTVVPPLAHTNSNIQQLHQIHMQQQQQILNGGISLQNQQQQQQQQRNQQQLHQQQLQQQQQQHQQQMQQLQQQLHLAQIQLQKTAAPPKQMYPNNPLGLARTQLESQIFSAQEVCQHIIGKLNTLMISNAYKKVRNYNEVKELHIHLSYLYKYTMGRFTTLQERCQEDMKKLDVANEAANSLADRKAKYKSDDDDLEIVEKVQVLIDLDSDDEAEKSPLKKTVPVSRSSPPVLIPLVQHAGSSNQEMVVTVDPAPVCIADEFDSDNELPIPPIIEEPVELPTVDINSDAKLKSKVVVRMQRVDPMLDALCEAKSSAQDVPSKETSQAIASESKSLEKDKDGNSSEDKAMEVDKTPNTESKKSSDDNTATPSVENEDLSKSIDEADESIITATETSVVDLIDTDSDLEKTLELVKENNQDITKGQPDTKEAQEHVEMEKRKSQDQEKENSDKEGNPEKSDKEDSSTDVPELANVVDDPPSSPAAKLDAAEDPDLIADLIADVEKCANSLDDVDLSLLDAVDKDDDMEKTDDILSDDEMVDLTEEKSIVAKQNGTENGLDGSNKNKNGMDSVINLSDEETDGTLDETKSPKPNDELENISSPDNFEDANSE